MLDFGQQTRFVVAERAKTKTAKISTVDVMFVGDSWHLENDMYGDGLALLWYGLRINCDNVAKVIISLFACFAYCKLDNARCK